MSDTALNTIIQYGTNAARIAFVPNPAPSSKVLYVWYETDNPPDTYVWDGSAWVQINGAGSGDVVGPGSSTDEALARFDGVTGKLLQDSLILLSNTGALTFPDDVRQTFNPGTNNAGLNVGAIAGDPSTPSNGDVWYDSTANELTARINGVNVVLGGAKPIYKVGITIDGGGSAITTGVKGYTSIPATGTIVRARMLADQSGSAVIDVWKDTFANYPPVNADSITAAAPPTLSAQDHSDDTTLTGWTTAVTAGDVLGFNVDSAATITRLHLELFIQPT